MLRSANLVSDIYVFRRLAFVSDDEGSGDGVMRRVFAWGGQLQWRLFGSRFWRGFLEADGRGKALINGRIAHWRTGRCFPQQRRSASDCIDHLARSDSLDFPPKIGTCCVADFPD